METYPVPVREIRAEITVVNSLFIASLAPAFSIDEARDFISRIKMEFMDASHNVSAFVIGHGNTVIAHSTDDGEPAGTAGRPALAVLQGSGLGDAVVVVTRYFGGTKLGTGGLVRAYGDAVRAVLTGLPRAKKVLTHTAIISIPYKWVDRLRRLIMSHQGEILEEIFAADVLVTARFETETFTDFQKALGEESHGTLSAETIGTEIRISPL